MRMSPSASSAVVGSSSTRRSACSPVSPKNTGMKSAVVSPRSCSSICRVRIGDCPMSSPAMKAPSTVCTPIAAVMSASTHISPMIAVVTGRSL